MTASLFLLPNGTFFIELGVFLVVLWFLAKKAIPKINTALEARQELIRTSLEAATSESGPRHRGDRHEDL